MDFATGDTEYELELRIPENPEGAPVLFVWHWLGGSASQAERYMDLEEVVGDDDVILVIPESDGSQFEWHFLDQPDGNPDLLLFDDVLSCLWQEYDVDLDRIHATGMSAGGLWTSYLTLHRSQWLASTAPLSGGATEGVYATPTDDIPVLLTWGGPEDIVSPLSFHDATLFLAENLREDGHFVIECEHDRAHDLPPGGIQYAYDFLMDHPKGIDPSPYADGLPSGFPDWCRQP
jgi:poly(3-hydroxybutyrate) depolymerase